MTDRTPAYARPMAAEILWEAFRLRPAYKNAAESELLMKLKYLARDPSFPTPSAEIMAAFDEAKVALERRDAQRRSGNGRVYCDPATKASLQQLLNLVKKDDDTKRLEEEEKASAAAWRDKYTMVLMEKNLLAEQYSTLKLQMEALQREHVEMKLKLQSGLGRRIPAEDVKVITNADSTWGVEKKTTTGDDGKKKRPSPPSTRARRRPRLRRPSAKSSRWWPLRRCRPSTSTSRRSPPSTRRPTSCLAASW